MSLLSLLLPRPALLPPCVAAVVTDGPEAVPVALRALRVAEDQQLPLLLLVPLPGTGSSVDRRRHAAEAAAVLGRVGPTLARAHADARHRVVLHADRAGSRRDVAVGRAVRDAAFRSGAVVLVAPHQLPVPEGALPVLRPEAAAAAGSPA